MKILKRLIPLVLLFSFLVPMGSIYAYTDGLLDTITPTLSKGTVTDINNMSDNDLSTSGIIKPASHATYTFSSLQTIKQVYVNVSGTNANTKIGFYNSTGVLIKQVTFSASYDSNSTVNPNGYTTFSTPIDGVGKIIIMNNGSTGDFTVTELDLYGESFDYHNGLIDIVGLTENSIVPLVLYDNDWNTSKGTSENIGGYTFEFKKIVDITKAYVPGNQDGLARSYTVTLFDINGNVLATNTAYKPTASSSYLNIAGNGVKKVFVKNNSTSYNDSLREIDFFGTVSNVQPSPITTNVSNFTASNTTTTGTILNWTNPIDSSFNGSKIYQNNELIATLDKTINSYSVSSLSPGTEYTFKITSINPDGSETTGTTQIIKTIEEIKEITNVEIETKYNRVNLSWNVPEQTIFKHVNIYRTEKEDSGWFSSLGATTAYAAEEETKIFETNGTYFNDLTVQPETTYEYTLTTQSTDGQESEGVTVEATTAAEPAPTIDNINYTVDGNGDYVYTWDSSTPNGQVRVVIDGEEYSLVPASDGTITIPGELVPTNILGEPMVSFQPIGEFGTVGQVENPAPTAITTPFGVYDLIGSGMALLGLVAPFVLLALAFLLVPKFRKIIYEAFGRFRKDKNQEKERRSSQDEPKEKHEGKEHLEKKERIERAEKERQERETRERIERDRERASKEIKTIQEKETKERIREPKERRERTLRAFGRVREPRQERAPRERTREPRQPRETREPRASRERRG